MEKSEQLRWEKRMSQAVSQPIYSAHNNTRVWAGEVRRFHAGVHVVVLHELHSTVMLHDHFLTWQPAASKMLYKMVDSVQEGRIILLLGAPEFTSWLQDKGTQALMNLGSQLGLFATLGEAWAFVARKGHAPVAETLITSRNSTNKDVSPLTFSMTLPLFHEKRCPWHQEPALATKAAFCETYEGYKEFCHCHHPLHLHPHTAPLMPLEEVIPVALVTAKRFPMVMRQVQQLWESPGGRQTPLAILVDGYDAQAEVLARLLNLTVRFHDNPVPEGFGTKHRVNEHIKFSLETIFQIYPEVDKAIILEDDLSLAPDFIRSVSACVTLTEKRCPWHQEPALATKAAFCETYEGYKEFCHCHHPLHLHPHTAPLMPLEEVIPVALVTAKRFPMVMRQVQQLWESPGGRQTPLAILVDGYDAQAEVLARLLNLTVRFHDNPVPRGEPRDA
ncbi:protein O-linked-mannose beta-1,2-N-acetylglucosaminyltransferase 1-like [Panulirus ornatus]|uniref:protein O-linked-mannose beta-1,2-N-acetylglucosaminyltransferase 1-like n=1 Tax=Panulirus ornatus TaxID=150431 RepID=UPI003A85319C